MPANSIRIFILAVCFLCLSVGSFAETIEAPSQISAVVVYPGAALVTRTAQLELAEGVHSIVLDNIVSEFDENSLNVSGEGKAQVKIMGALLKREFLQQAADEQVKELKKKIEEIDDKIAAENDSLSVIQKEREFIDSIKLYSGNQIPKDLVTKMPTTDELKSVLNFIAENFKQLDISKQEVQLKIKGLYRDREVLQKELDNIGYNNSNVNRQIIVDVECEKAGHFTLDVSYLVSGPAWRPLYDARVSSDAEAVALTAFGIVQQATGEDWKDVNLTLSTARPSVSGSMPYVSPWIISVYQPPQPQAMLKAARMLRADVAQEAQYSPEAFGGGGGPVDEMEAANNKASMAFTQVESKGLSVMYRIPKKVTVKSDGTEQKFPVAAQALKAQFEYSSYPRVSPYCYLGTKVTNDKELQLLAGQVKIFLEGDFVGISSIDAVGPGEEFSLYLGIDENVKVKRDELERKVDDVLIGGIPSPNRKTSFKYRLAVENYKNKPIRVNLFDAIPFSDNDRIKVKTTNVSMEPKEKDWEKRSGIWRWEFELAPSEKKEIFLDYFIEHARDLQIQGL